MPGRAARTAARGCALTALLAGAAWIVPIGGAPHPSAARAQRGEASGGAAQTAPERAGRADGSGPEGLPAAFRLPWTDVAPALRGGAVRAAAVGMPDPRIGRFSARRASARTDGRRRALRAIHAWVDDALAEAQADPRQAQRVHAAVRAAARVDGVRALVDAGAVVVVSVPRSALRAACDARGLPW